MAEWCLAALPNGSVDSLSLDFQDRYGCARWNGKLPDFLNDAGSLSLLSVLGLDIDEQSSDFFWVDTGPVSDDLPDPAVVFSDSR